MYDKKLKDFFSTYEDKKRNSDVLERVFNYLDREDVKKELKLETYDINRIENCLKIGDYYNINPFVCCSECNVNSFRKYNFFRENYKIFDELIKHAKINYVHKVPGEKIVEMNKNIKLLLGFKNSGVELELVKRNTFSPNIYRFNIKKLCE